MHHQIIQININLIVIKFNFSFRLQRERALAAERGMPPSSSSSNNTTYPPPSMSSIVSANNSLAAAVAASIEPLPPLGRQNCSSDGELHASVATGVTATNIAASRRSASISSAASSAAAGSGGGRRKFSSWNDYWQNEWWTIRCDKCVYWERIILVTRDSTFSPCDDYLIFTPSVKLCNFYLLVPKKNFPFSAWVKNKKNRHREQEGKCFEVKKNPDICI